MPRLPCFYVAERYGIIRIFFHAFMHISTTSGKIISLGLICSIVRTPVQSAPAGPLGSPLPHVRV
jgi:hypothetical protein